MTKSAQELQVSLERAQRHHAAGRFADAEAGYREILGQNPHHVGAMHLLGLLLFQQGKQAEGMSLMAQSVQIVPNNAAMCFNYGNALMQSGDSAGAVAQFRRALELQPNYPEAMNNLSVALSKQGQFADAAVVARLVLAQRPSSPEAIRNLSQALRGLGDQAMHERDYPKAVDSYEQAIKANRGNVSAQLGLGYAYSAIGDRRAEQYFREAVRLKKDSDEACLAMARWLDKAGRREEAVQWFERTLALNPEQAAAWADLAAVCGELRRVDQAIAHAKRALELEPENIAAAATLGAALSNAGRNEEAAAVLLDAVQRTRIDEAPHPGQDHFSPDQRKALAGVLSNLFLLRHYGDRYDPEQLFQEHLVFGRLVDRRDPNRHFDLSPRQKLRIGYVSGDFRGHSVAFFIEPVIERHDRDAFEIYLYATETHDDVITRRLRNYAVHWRTIHQMSDEEALDLIRSDRIDILVDLSGHTGGNRLPLFGLKPAPLQVTWLGYPDTTGLSTIDYRITDAIADPPGQTDRYHTERLWRLPRSAWCYRPFAAAPEVAPLPCESTGRLSFGCFNAARKINATTARLWASLLHAVPDSRLVLKSRELDDEATRGRILELLASGGVPSERVEVLRRDPLMAAHLASYHQIDIALDPFPYNGTTTTCDALLMGVPVISLAGGAHVSRVGASLLSSVGLPELVASSSEEYVAIAVQLATDRPRLAELRRSLRGRLRSSPLCDEAGFTRDLEAAYEAMWRQCVAQEASAGGVGETAGG